MSKEQAAAGTDPDKTPKEGEDEEFIAVETDAAGRPLNGSDTVDQGEDHDADDDDDQDEDEDDDERRGHAEGDQDDNSDETPEQKRARRRNENKAKRIRNRVAGQARERLLQTQAETIQDLTSRLAKLEGRTTRADINLLRDKAAQIESQLGDAKRTHAELAKAQDWEGVAEINEIQLTLREQHRNIKIALQRAQQDAQNAARDDDDGEGRRSDGAQPARKSAAAKVDPAIREKAQTWFDKHEWLKDPEYAEDAEIVRALDRVVAKEGYDPRTDEYWRALDKRVKARLPHHFKAANNGSRRQTVDDDTGNNRPQNRGPNMRPASQTGGGRRALKPNEVYISPERKKAMQEAGMWDDPVKRNKQLKAYRDWDRNNAAASEQ